MSFLLRRRKLINFIIYRTLSFACQGCKEEWKNDSYIKLLSDLFLVKPLVSEDSLRQELYFFDFSVLLYFMNDQFSILNYCFPVLSAELGTWQAFPLERNVLSFVLVCRSGCLFRIWLFGSSPGVWAHYKMCTSSRKKKGINLVFGEKNGFTAGFSSFLSLGVFSSN